MQDDGIPEDKPARLPWSKPSLASASIKEITSAGQGSGADGGTMPGMEMNSDARLKTDITRKGTSPTGLPIYTFRYIWGGQRYEGTMAQDLLALRPDAVSLDKAGYYRVDYSRLDIVPRVLQGTTAIAPGFSGSEADRAAPHETPETARACRA